MPEHWITNKLPVGNKVKKMKHIIIVLFLVFGFESCYYDTEEELYPTIECSTTDMSYQADILPIFQNNCYQCHDAANNFGGITLEGFEQVKNYVNNNQLLGVIKHEAGFSPMPKNTAKLLDCEIEKIEAWISDGALNN